MSAAEASGYWPRHRTDGAFRRVTRRDPCRVCGVEKWCREFEDGGVECMRVESGTPCRSGGWMHWPDGRPDDGRRERVFVVPPKPGADRLPPAELDAVYAELRRRCPLSDAHRRALHGRGFTDAEIAARGYATLPGPGRAAIARALVDRFGERIVGRVPGLFLSNKGRAGATYPTFGGAAGLLIPMRDAERRTAGLQVRRDDEPSIAGHRPKRYAWFSSLGRPGGCGSGAPLHIAVPTTITNTVTDVYITEGPLKADFAADRLGAAVVALPGVGNRAGVVAALRAQGATRGIVAFDQDGDEDVREHVQRAADTLAGELLVAGVQPMRATWTRAHKGIDDAIAAGVEITVAPYPAHRIKRRPGMLEAIPGDLLPGEPPRRLSTLAEARAEHERLFRDLILGHAEGATVVASATGTGKTGSLARAVADLWAQGWPSVAKRTGDGTRPLRLLYLAQTKEQVVGFAEATGWRAAVIEGRNADPNHDWGCHRPDAVGLVGERRHNPAVDVCQRCRDENEARWGRGWLCNYLTMKKATELAPVVAAPLGSFLNGSGELRQFDVVVVDEAIVPSLTEVVVLTPFHVRDWLARMTELNAEAPRLATRGWEEPERYGLDNLFRRFVLALDLVVAQAAHVGQEWRPVLPLLREVCPDLDELIGNLLPLEPNDSTGRYPFETPNITMLGNDPEPGSLVPLRLIRDLIAAVAAELERPDGADTRLWLSPEGLRLFVVRDHLVEILRRRTLVNLDATPDPTLRRLFPDMTEVRVETPAPMRVTQVTDSLATRRELLGPGGAARRERIGAALETVTADASAPVVFTFKDLDPNVAGGERPALAVGNPLAQYGHFDAETRGVNRFADADVLAIVGRYSHPLSDLRAQVQGLRFALVPPGGAGDRIRLLPYRWRGPDGNGLGRWTRSDPDPDVDAQVRWSEASTVVQAIGRGRAPLNPDGAPLDVYLFTNLPIADLPVDRLITLTELGADPPRRTTPPEFYAERDRRNAEAAAGNRERVVAAIIALQEEGAPVTLSAVADRSGVSRKTIYQQATLKALVDQARSGSNQPPATRFTAGVTPSPGDERYVYDQGVTPAVNADAPPRPPADVARSAAIAAGRASDPAALQRHLHDLEAALTLVAEARGRSPAPKPGRQVISQEAS